MKVLAFDVGIKHLAYCILEREINIETQEIKYIISDYRRDWNIIDIIIDETIKCNYGVCNNEECENTITLYTEIENKKFFLCTKHKKHYQEILNNNPIIIRENINDKKCCFSSCCKLKSKWLIGEQELCNKHKINIENKLIKNKQLQRYTNFVKSFSTHDLKLRLLEKLEGLKEIFLQVDYVCIENQPTLKNPTMKAISDVIYTWFMIRGVLDKNIYNSRIKDISFFSPSNKLKIKNKTEEIANDIENAVNKYKTTKDLAIKNCLIFIKHNQEYVDYLNSFKKKDDLCDAFLHGVNFIEKKIKMI